LHLAARDGHKGWVRLLLEWAEVAWEGSYRKAPLCLAARDGDGDGDGIEDRAKVVAVLATKDNCGRTALYLAAENGHWGVVRQLLKNGAELTGTDENKQTALYQAVDN
jgi:ankyrin repeat protein